MRRRAGGPHRVPSEEQLAAAGRAQRLHVVALELHALASEPVDLRGQDLRAMVPHVIPTCRNKLQIDLVGTMSQRSFSYMMPPATQLEEDSDFCPIVQT